MASYNQQQPGMGQPQVVISQPQVIGGCQRCRVCKISIVALRLFLTFIWISLKQAGVYQDEFTCCGIVLAILFFPIGLLCCYVMREKRCSNCGSTIWACVEGKAMRTKRRKGVMKWILKPFNEIKVPIVSKMENVVLKNDILHVLCKYFKTCTIDDSSLMKVSRSAWRRCCPIGWGTVCQINLPLLWYEFAHQPCSDVAMLDSCFWRKGRWCRLFCCFFLHYLKQLAFHLVLEIEQKYENAVTS